MKLLVCALLLGHLTLMPQCRHNDTHFMARAAQDVDRPSSQRDTFRFNETIVFLASGPHWANKIAYVELADDTGRVFAKTPAINIPPKGAAAWPFATIEPKTVVATLYLDSEVAAPALRIRILP